MTAIIDTLVAAGVFLAGMAARLGLVLAVMLVLLVPVVLLAGGVRALRSLELRLQGYRPAGRLRFRSGLLYAPGHTWVKPEGSRLRVGIDDLAQMLLPWAVAVSLPRPGQAVRAEHRPDDRTDSRTVAVSVPPAHHDVADRSFEITFSIEQGCNYKRGVIDRVNPVVPAESFGEPVYRSFPCRF